MSRMIEVDGSVGEGGAVRVALVASAYNAWVTDRLVAGAREAFGARVGVREEAELVIARVPGTFELPAGCAAAIGSGRFDAVVALGCVIKGETRHDEVIADAVVQGLTALTVRTGVPIGLGVLTVNSADQAEARAGGALGNKGAEAMEAALDTLGVVRMLRDFEDG